MASKMKIALGVVGGLVGLAMATFAGAWLWVGSTVNSYMSKTFETHVVDFPVPFPLTAAEIEALRAERLAAMPPVDPAAPVDLAAPADPLAGVDLDAIARERAAARGQHLVEARYVCVECHGKNFAGGTMIDDPMIGTLLGKNITLGAGSVTLDYKPTDWDRIVRHGVLPDGTAAVMPSEDFVAMSDHELSDIITYVRSQPPVDATVPDPVLGPLGKVLIATGQLPLAPYRIADHQGPHRVEPPAEMADAEYGSHLAQVCVGCHNTELTGGPVTGGDPNWPPAANLTPHEQGLGAWTYEQFDAFLRTGTRPDGTVVQQPMIMVVGYTKNTTETESQALWAYLRSIPPLPDKI